MMNWAKWSFLTRRALEEGPVSSESLASYITYKNDDTQSITAASLRSASSSQALLRPSVLKLSEISTNSSFVDRSPGPFSDSLVPAVSRSEVRKAPLPPTKNELSPEAKRDLVKRNKKLGQLLGTTLNEKAAERQLLGRAGRSFSGPEPLSPKFLNEHNSPILVKRSSFPPASPNQSHSAPPSPGLFSDTSELPSKTPELSDTLTNSSSSGAPADFTSPDTNSESPLTPRDFSPTIAWQMRTGKDTKEERRKRIHKVYALLGEVVPTGLITGMGDLDIHDPPVFQEMASSTWAQTCKII